MIYNRFQSTGQVLKKIREFFNPSQSVVYVVVRAGKNNEGIFYPGKRK